MYTRTALAIRTTGNTFAKSPFLPLITDLQSRPRPLRVTQACRCLSMAGPKDFFLDEFAQKQFNDSDPNYSGTRIRFNTAKFVAEVQRFHDNGAQLVDGYAPFCKHIFVENFAGAKLGALAIKQGNQKLLQSGYSRRRPEELPVLTRSEQCLMQTCSQ